MAKEAILRVGPQDAPEEYILQLGGIDPISEVSGVTQRLRNLGFECGSAADGVEIGVEQALKDFQTKHSLPATGRADAETLARLAADYGA